MPVDLQRPRRRIERPTVTQEGHHRDAQGLRAVVAEPLEHRPRPRVDGTLELGLGQDDVERCLAVNHGHPTSTRGLSG